MHNTEDKQFWCEKGMNMENAFITYLVPLMNRNIIINPDKEKNKYAIDFYDLDNNRYADLKTQNTPFFTANKRGYDPQYAVTFNYKDYNRYKKLYPTSDIYFCVKWNKLSGYGTKVEPLCGVWVTPFRDIANTIESNSVKLHDYNRRIDDSVNGKNSFILDLNNFERIL